MRAAVVGLGVIGTVHAEIILQNKEELVAVCDTDGGKLAGYAARGYTDYRELLARERIDVVHICTPHYLHAEMIIAFLNAGVNVLVEKPLCIREEEIPAILRAEARSSAQLGVCLQNRYNPSSLYVKKRLGGQRVFAATGTLSWHRDAAYYRSAQWRGKKETEGGGVLINQALHTVDLLEWLAGTPQFVSAKICNLSLKGEIEVEDTAALACTGGADFTLFATNCSATDLPVTLSLQTEREHILLLPSAVLVGEEYLSFSSEPFCSGKACYGGSHRALIADFYGCVRRGVPFPIGGEEGAKSVKIVLAAYKSKGERVEI